MKRFITFTMAVLLGLVSSQQPSSQTDFETNSKGLVLSKEKEEKENIAAIAASCLVYEDLTLFNLTEIRGPYQVNFDLDKKGANNDTETLEVRFCNPVLQNNAADKKKSLVFLRKTNAADDNLKRAARLTSGDISFSSKTVLRNDNGDITGITLVAQESSDKSGFCKDNTPWTVSFNVMCNATETKALSYDKFTSKSDPNKCTLDFTAYHNAGCGLVKTSGFVQYLNSNPWLVAVILIAAGIATCFFGGQLIDWVYIGVPALFAFLFVTVLLSSFGTFSVLEEDNPTTGKGVIQAIVGFVISAVAAIAAGFLANKLQRFASGILGGIAGFFLGFLLYSLVFAIFI